MMATKFGKLLRERRKAGKKTMGEVADTVGCTVSFVSDVELGRRKPFQAGDISKIARMIGATRDEELRLQMAAAHERGSVAITNPRMQGIAAALARSGDRLSAEQIAEIEARIEDALRSTEDDE